MTTRAQQRPATLKAFVRVSKNSEGPSGKDGLKPPGRITRSRSAALAAPATSATQEAPHVDKQTEIRESRPAAQTPTRKRKLEPAAPSPAEDAESNPAKRVTRAARTPQRRATPMRNTTSKRTVKRTTIEAYFPSSPTAHNKGKGNKAVDATTVNTLSDREKGSPSSKDDATAIPTEPCSDSVDKLATRHARADSLLKRLRNRKRPDSAVVDLPAPATIQETRDIRESIRARREKSSTEHVLKSDAASSFVAGKSRTVEDDKLRDLKRQFVKIDAQTGSAVPLSRELHKLEELFQGLEHTVMFDGNGSDGVVYHRIRKTVESMAKRTFGWKELGQILALYPESYTYKPIETMHSGRRVQSVTLVPVARRMNLAIEMESRREEFGRRLRSLVADAHKGFLIARGFVESDLSDMRGWHPLFDIESTPSVTPLPLPPVSVKAQQAAGSVAAFDKEKLKHLLGKVHTKTSAAAGAASSVTDKQSGDAGHDPDTATGSKGTAATAAMPMPAAALPTPTSSPCLQPAEPESKPKEKPTSRANALLERIRAKQRAKEKASKEQAEAAVSVAARSLHSRLPGILDAVSFLYYAERKNVLPFFYVVDKLIESKCLDKPDVTKHLLALADIVPEWCSVNDADPKNPSPDARLKVTRVISLQEAQRRLQSKSADH
ncbi:hypothetical protein H4R20_003075 [Coemansia guatemalensis]|uniref:CDT1 Geminin-binding domain-containing protein n=1 Tax=Coemansia guatemalensis TaxID=2761395 RepID=A0A9W8HWR0_9FUNG|nr:hypothetical protein H4R20_003075 [Coemansia guatemalensis]